MARRRIGSIGKRERPKIKALRLGAYPRLPIVELSFFIRVGVKGVKVEKGNGKKAVFAVKSLPVQAGHKVETILIMRAVQIAAAPGVLRVGPILNRPCISSIH